MVDETTIYEMPSFTGFYPFKMRQQTDEEPVEYFRNRLYRVRTLHKVLLVPFTTGKLMLGPMEVSSAIQFIQRTKQAAAKPNTLDELLDQIDEEESLPKIVQQIILKSEPLELDIHPLPVAQQPGFTGTIGQFVLHATVAKQEFMSGEINKMELTLTGRGYSPATDTPKMNWPPGFTIENIESKDNYEEEDFYLNGIKKITYFFSVNEEGYYTIPPGLFLYFDPAQAVYKPLRTNAYKLHVKGRVRSILTKHDLTRTPKEDGLFSKNFITSNVLFTIGVVVVILLSVLSLTMFAFDSTKIQKVESSSILSANREVDTRLESPTSLFLSAKGSLAKNNHPVFLLELQSDLISTIGDHLGIPAPELRINKLSNILKEKDYNESISDEIVALLKELETKLYMPNQDMNDCQRLLQEAERIVAHLERDRV